MWTQRLLDYCPFPREIDVEQVKITHNYQKRNAFCILANLTDKK